MAYTTTTYPASASAYYSQYASQPAYSVEPHPYEGLYTTNAYLQPETTYVERPSSRRTVSPSSSAEHTESSSKGHRRRRSSVYLEAGGSPSRRSRERELQREEDLRIQKELEKRERHLRREEKRIEKELSERRQRERECEREAAKPEKTKPISLPRSSTMPTGHLSTETRGRRPILITEYVDDTGATSARIPLGPVEYVEHASKGRASKRYSSSSGYERPVTPQGYASNEEENNRRKEQRARHREEFRAFPSSAPERGSHYQPAYYDAYGSSAGSSASGFTPPPSRSGHRRMSSSASRDSAAVDTAVKSLRWADQETRRGIQDQNDRISQRPKLSRSESVKANRPLHTEVKSILKNGSGQNSANSTGVPTTPTTPNSASRPSSSDRRRRESFSRRDLDDLTRGMQGLSTEDPEYRRLASRFTRRHSTYGPGPDSAYRTHYSDRYP